MVAVDLRERARPDVPPKQLSCINYRKPDVGQAALVGAASGIANYDGQDIDSQMVAVGAPDGAADQISAVAAAKVADDGCLAPEKPNPVDYSLGWQLLQASLGPKAALQDF